MTTTTTNKTRYLRALLWALPIAAAVGAILGPIFLLTVNTRYLASGGLSGLIFGMTFGAVFGAVTGLCALIGGYWRVASRAKAPVSSPHRRVKDARVGAAWAVGLGWVLFALAVGVITRSIALGLVVQLIGVVCVVLSALVAGWLVAADEHRGQNAAAAVAAASPVESLQ